MLTETKNLTLKCILLVFLIKEMCCIVVINCGLLFFVPVVGHFAAQVYVAAGNLPSIKLPKKIVIKSACESSLIYLNSEFFSFLFSCCFFRLILVHLFWIF